MSNMAWIHFLLIMSGHTYRVISLPFHNKASLEIAPVSRDPPIECITPDEHIGEAPVSFAICAIAISFLDQAITENPNPVIWGEGGVESLAWFDAEPQCTIHVGGAEGEGYPQQRFRLIRIKKLVSRILTYCSSTAYGYDFGGNVEPAPEMELLVFGNPEPLRSNSTGRNSSNTTFISLRELQN